MGKRKRAESGRLRLELCTSAGILPAVLRASRPRSPAASKPPLNLRYGNKESSRKRCPPDGVPAVDARFARWTAEAARPHTALPQLIRAYDPGYVARRGRGRPRHTGIAQDFQIFQASAGVE